MDENIRPPIFGSVSQSGSGEKGFDGMGHALCSVFILNQENIVRPTVVRYHPARQRKVANRQ